MKQTREHNEDGKYNDINHAIVALIFFLFCSVDKWIIKRKQL